MSFLINHWTEEDRFAFVNIFFREIIAEEFLDNGSVNGLVGIWNVETRGAYENPQENCFFFFFFIFLWDFGYCLFHIQFESLPCGLNNNTPTCVCGPKP